MTTMMDPTDQAPGNGNGSGGADTPNQNGEGQAQGAQPNDQETKTEPGQPGGEDWRSMVPEGFRDKAWLSKYKTPEDLFKGIDEMQGVLGKKAVGLVPPGENATDEEKATYQGELRKALGVPDKPEGYQIAMPEGLNPDPVMFPWFQGAAHKAGLSPSQAQALSDEYNAFAAKYWGQNQEQAQAAQEQARKDSVAQLDKMAGGEGKGSAFAEHARRGFTTVAAKAGLNPTEIAHVDGLFAHDVAMVRLFNFIGKQMGEHDFVDGTPGSGSTNQNAGGVLFPGFKNG